MTLCESGPPNQVVIIYGEVAMESMSDRFLSVDVSEMKTVRQ